MVPHSLLLIFDKRFQVGTLLDTADTREVQITSYAAFNFNTIPAGGNIMTANVNFLNSRIFFKNIGFAFWKSL